MRNTIQFLLLFVVCKVTTGADYYVDVPYSGQDSIVQWLSRGYEVAGISIENKTLTLLANDHDMKRVQMLSNVRVRKIQVLDTGFHKFSEVEKFLFDMQDQYPHLAKLEKIGDSIEGRPIYAIQITSRFVKPDAPRKVLLVDAMHHAREVMTPEVAMDMIEYLLSNYSSDEKVFNWVNQNEIWVIPMLNPDGNEKVWNSSPMWRKNARGGYGVDINRNYPYGWNSCGGSSGNKNADDFRGPNPASEPETQAIMGLANKIKPNFGISYHTFSELVIYPYGCSPNRLPNSIRQKYEGMGQELASKLVRDSGRGTYDPGTCYELLYNADGGSEDWLFATHGTFAFVIEVNSENQGFQPSYSWRDSTVERQRPGWMYILDQMAVP